jgi:hypothetical protein
MKYDIDANPTYHTKKTCQPMRVLFLTGREIQYPRNDVLLRAFRRFSQVTVMSEKTTGSLITRSLRVGLQALPQLSFGKYDLVFVGFYGHFLMLPIGLLTQQPILFDAFLSTYDTMSFDRQTFGPQTMRGRLAFWLDQTACRLADHVLLDTEEQVTYFNHTFNLPLQALSALHVGNNEDLFYPQSGNRQDRTTSVLYYCSYLPLHGVETVIRAAASLKKEAIHFRLIGSGLEYNRIRSLADELALQNITFVPPVSLAALPEEIATADICLGGHFGSSPKAARVIPGKIYQILAMARPVIATTTPANQRLLSHMETAYLCPPHDPEALAASILALHRDPALRHHLAGQGRRLYEAQCSEAVITAQLRKLVGCLAKST